MYNAFHMIIIITICLSKKRKCAKGELSGYQHFLIFRKRKKNATGEIPGYQHFFPFKEKEKLWQKEKFLVISIFSFQTKGNNLISVVFMQIGEF